MLWLPCVEPTQKCTQNFNDNSDIVYCSDSCGGFCMMEALIIYYTRRIKLCEWLQPLLPILPCYYSVHVCGFNVHKMVAST